MRKYSELIVPTLLDHRIITDEEQDELKSYLDGSEVFEYA